MSGLVVEAAGAGNAVGYIVFAVGVGAVGAVGLIAAFVMGARRKAGEPAPAPAGGPRYASWSTPSAAPKAVPDDTCDAPSGGDHP
jgi:O-antigen/teichoic acid export membrane protein